MVQLNPLIHAFSALVQAASQQSSSGELAVRQSGGSIPISSLPTQCQAGCQVLQTIVNCGSSQSCVCTNSIASQLVSCINCLEAAEPNNANLAGEGQTLITDFNQLCGSDLTLSSPSGGSTGSGSGTTGSGSGTTGSGSGTTGSGSGTTGSGSGSTGSGSGSGSGSGIGPKFGGAVSLKTAGMGICVAATAIGAYLAL